ncbi:hypothetical protein [Tissierella sp.]|uniref:hypothetical protein n=1 Tax=Tissierella sp. TaxID=41274 RepID=UPI002856D00F|nr:hypothetical protein [Tissierella sp.]MDR7856025.1 hypothetical protein [Tissierella sp.]
MKLIISDIREYQNKMETVKSNGFKANDFKELGRELRDKFNLSDREAISILNGKDEEILKILERQEEC